MALTTFQLTKLIDAYIILTKFLSTSGNEIITASQYDVPCEGKLNNQKLALQYLFAVQNVGYLSSDQVDTLLGLVTSVCGSGYYVTEMERINFIHSKAGIEFLVDADGDGVPDIVDAVV
jgi:hypothetical protein